MDCLIFRDILNAILSIFKWAKLMPKIKYIVNYYFASPINIVVLGASGTGKSQFTKFFSGDSSKSIHRTRQVVIRTFTLPNGRRIKYFDLPGHDSYALIRKDVFEKFIIRNKIKGIINVVSYGYHEYENKEELKIFKTGTYDVREEYLRENRNREIQQLDEWTSYNLYNHISWIITIVNKADIWHENSDIVMTFYEEGEYASKLSKFKDCLSIHTFEYCSIIEPFCNKPMKITIGESKKDELQNDFIENILQFIKGND